MPEQLNRMVLLRVSRDSSQAVDKAAVIFKA